MKRRIKKEVFDSIEPAINRTMAQLICDLLEQHSYLSDSAYEPEPFECWVCRNCNVVIFVRDCKCQCTEAPIKMRQVEE